MTVRHLVAVLLLAFSAAEAQDTPVVRIEVTPEAVNVGEPARLRVTVLVPTWFPQPPVFPSFELSNAITRLPPDSSFPTSERMGRDTWSGIVRNYRVYPMLGATYTIADRSIRVTYANPGSEPIIVDTPVPEITFRGVVPEGAEGLDPYLAGRRFSLTREVEGELERLEAGDAVVIRYVAELEGLPAIFIPPLLPDLAIPGVSVYADEPEIRDGEPGTRTEQVTLVFEAGGDFVIPAIGIDWWNTSSDRIETASVDPLSLSVSGPVFSTPEAEAVVSTDWQAMVISLLAATLFLFALLRLWPVVVARRAAAKAEYEQSEQFAYRRLQSALNTDDAGGAHAQMLAWLSRAAPGYELRQFAREFGSGEFEAALTDYLTSMYSATDTSPDPARLASGFDDARHACLRSADRQPEPALPPLNP
jgi:hypothetical protein